MFGFFKKKIVTEQPVERKLSQIEVQVSQLIAGTSFSNRDVFAELVRRSFQKNISNFPKYHVKCSDLHVDEELYRISGTSDAAIFYSPETDEIFTMEYSKDDNKEDNRDRHVIIASPVDWNTAIINYVKRLVATDETVIKIHELLKKE